MANQEKKKGHPVRNTAAAAVILAALFGGGRFGLGIGGGGGIGIPSLLPAQQSGQSSVSAPAESSSQPAESSSAGEAEESVIAIVVRENEILYRGQAVDLAALEEALLHDYSDQKTVTLTDEHAIKASYDAVAALLGKHGIPFNT